MQSNGSLHVQEMYSVGKVVAAIGHGVGPLASVPVPERTNGYLHGFTNGYANGATDSYSGRRMKYDGARFIITDKPVSITEGLTAVRMLTDNQHGLTLLLGSRLGRLHRPMVNVLWAQTSRS